VGGAIVVLLRLAETGPISWIVVGLASVIFVLLPKLHPALVLVGGGAVYVAAYFLGLTGI